MKCNYLLTRTCVSKKVSVLPQWSHFPNGEKTARAGFTARAIRASVSFRECTCVPHSANSNAHKILGKVACLDNTVIFEELHVFRIVLVFTL